MIKLLKKLKFSEWMIVLFSIVLIAGQVWLDLKIPDYMQYINNNIRDGNQSAIWGNGGYMLLCAFGSAILSVIVGFFAARVASALAKRIREETYQKVQDFSMEEINRFSTASLITRSTNDVTQVQNVVAIGLQLMIKAPILAVWAITKILGKSWQFSIATAVAVAVLLVVVVSIGIGVMPRFKKVQKLTDELNNVTRENLTGVRVVRAYNAEDYQEDKFEKTNENLTKQTLTNLKIMQLIGPTINLVMNGLNLTIFWIGAFLVSAASIANKYAVFNNTVIFSMYAMQVVMAFMLLTMTFIMLPRAQVSANRINEILDTEPTIKNGTKESSKVNNGTIEFKNVSFSYPDAEENVLENISFKVGSGETIAFIGSTGSGKSTLINLIPRFYEVSSGEILIDNVNIKEYTQECLHNKIGYIPQKAVMFSGSVKSNIDFGDSARGEMTDDDIVESIEISQSKEMVENMDNGIDSEINQGGTNISGGQKQRLAIARAIARKPEILVFDDSFSALDYKTDKKLRKALSNQKNKATRLIVTQRIGTIRDADKIIVLEDGKIVGNGTHIELMKNCEIYQEIAYSQLSKEELD